MKAGWKRVRLGDICKKITDGSHNPPKGVQSSDYMMLSSKNIFDDRIILDDPRFLNESDFRNEDKRTDVNPGDVLLTIVGTIGRVAVVNDELPKFTLQRSVAVLKARKDIVNPRFLMRSLQNILDELAENARGVAQKGLYLGQIQSLEIPIPPLPEQHRIVSILDEAFEGIDTAVANAEQNLVNAREVFESVLSSIFIKEQDGWTELSSITSDISDGDHQPPPKATDGIPFITISNINKRTREIDFSDTFKVPEEYYLSLKPHRKPIKGDILYTVTGSYGIPIIVSENKEFCFQRHIGLVRPTASTISKWLYYLMLSPQIMRQADSCATGTAQKTVSLSSLRNFQVPKTSISEQKSIVAKLDELSTETQRLESIYQQKLTALDELKKSILHQAFSGQMN